MLSGCYCLGAPSSDCALSRHGWRNQQGIGLSSVCALNQSYCCRCRLLIYQSESSFVLIQYVYVYLIWDLRLLLILFTRVSVFDRPIINLSEFAICGETSILLLLFWSVSQCLARYISIKRHGFIFYGLTSRCSPKYSDKFNLYCERLRPICTHRHRVLIRWYRFNRLLTILFGLFAANLWRWMMKVSLSSLDLSNNCIQILLHMTTNHGSRMTKRNLWFMGKVVQPL
jgi:hypothetical protein